MDLNQEQIHRLEEVTKSRNQIIRANFVNGWFNFVMLANGIEYPFRIPATDAEIEWVLEGGDVRPQETNLTPRQWAVYRLIKINSLVEHRKTSQREIFERVDGFVWNDEDAVHDHCPAIWSDIAKNNLSFEHQHLIINDKFEYWIGSKRECQEYLKKLWNDLAPRLHRYWQYVKLLGYDGQGRLYDKNLNPINPHDDTVDAINFFFSAFNDYDIEMQKEANNE